MGKPKPPPKPAPDPPLTKAQLEALLWQVEYSPQDYASNRSISKGATSARKGGVAMSSNLRRVFRLMAPILFAQLPPVFLAQPRQFSGAPIARVCGGRTIDAGHTVISVDGRTIPRDN